MRASATLIGISSLLMALALSGCDVQPLNSADMRKELNKIPGPDTGGGVEATLKAQAEKAAAAGDCKGAMQYYQQLVMRSPQNYDYPIEMAGSERHCGDNETALKILDAVLKRDPNNAAALESKGLSLINTGDFSDASRTFGEVMKIDPKRWRTLDGIGILFAMKNMTSEAVDYYQAALNQSTANVSVLNNLGLTYALDRQYDKAIESFERARRHLAADSPEMKNVSLNLALVYAISGDLDNAQQTAAPYLSKAGLYNNMGFYAYLSKNTDLSKSYLNMALTQSPTYYERAWKNLSAVTGDNAEESNENSDGHGGAKNQLSPAEAKSKGFFPATTEHTAAVPQAPVVGTSLDEIPESKSISADGKSASPSSGEPVIAKKHESKPVVVKNSEPVVVKSEEQDVPVKAPVEKAKKEAKPQDQDKPITAKAEDHPKPKQEAKVKPEPKLKPEPKQEAKAKPEHEPKAEPDEKPAAPAADAAPAETKEKPGMGNLAAPSEASKDTKEPQNKEDATENTDSKSIVSVDKKPSGNTSAITDAASPDTKLAGKKEGTSAPAPKAETSGGGFFGRLFGKSHDAKPAPTDTDTGTNPVPGGSVKPDDAKSTSDFPGSHPKAASSNLNSKAIGSGDAGVPGTDSDSNTDKN